MKWKVVINMLKNVVNSELIQESVKLVNSTICEKYMYNAKGAKRKTHLGPP